MDKILEKTEYRKRVRQTALHQLDEARRARFAELSRRLEAGILMQGEIHEYYDLMHSGSDEYIRKLRTLNIHAK